MKIKSIPHIEAFILQPLDAQANLTPDEYANYCMFDRVINIREGYTVPPGLRGTIIGIISAEKERDVVYEVLFDENFLGGLTLR